MTRSRNRKGRRNRYVYDVPQKEPQMNDGTLTLDQIKQLATKMSKGTRGRRPSDCSFVSAYAASEKHKTPQLYFAFKGDDMAYFDTECAYELYFIEAFNRLYFIKGDGCTVKEYANCKGLRMSDLTVGHVIYERVAEYPNQKCSFSICVDPESKLPYIKLPKKEA